MDGIELMAGAMRVARARLDVSAANLANVSSGGFARRIAHVSLGTEGLHFSAAADSQPGPLERTGRALDLAVSGKGAFFVRHGASVVRERSASLSLDRSG